MAHDEEHERPDWSDVVEWNEAVDARAAQFDTADVVEAFTREELGLELTRKQVEIVTHVARDEKAGGLWKA